MKNKNINNVAAAEHSGCTNNNQDGGFLSKIFGSDVSNYSTKLCLDAFQARLPNVSIYVLKHAINNELTVDFGKQDNNGRTILHWMVGHSAKNPEAKKLLLNILEMPNISNVINKQDNDGNTVVHVALHVAEKTDVMDEIISLLEKKGANFDIENKEGKKIQSDSDKPVVNKKQKELFVKKKNKNVNDTIGGTDIEDVIRKITNQFVVNTEHESETINFNRNSLEKSSDKKDSDKKDSDRKDNVLFGGCEEETINTDQIINELLSKNRNKSLKKTMVSLEKQSVNFTGGQMGMRKKLSYDSEQNLSSSSLTNSSKSSISQQKSRFFDAVTKMGGAIDSSSNISLSSMSSLDATPKRKTNANFSETSNLNSQTGSAEKSSSSSITTSSSSGDDAEKSSSSSTTSDEDPYSSEGGMIVDDAMEENGLKKLGRFKNEESIKRHEETVRRIMKNLSVDELKAKAYKALLWTNIKNSHKELNNDELSIELEKQSSDKKNLESFVKKLDKSEVEKMEKIISEKKKHKKEHKKENKKENKKDKDINRFMKELSEELDAKSNDESDAKSDSESDKYTSD